jgi:zona occludens toxin (predicted ATPase)
LFIASTEQELSQEAEELKFQFATAVYDDQDKISNTNLANVATKDIPQVIFDAYVSKVNPKIKQQDYINAMTTRPLWDEARETFKLATFRSVFGTPTFFVNGVQIYNGGSFGLQDWIQLFNQLLK